MIIYDHLPAPELEDVIRGAALVIARSGYSTIMDLVRLKKRAVLVPTPGQTEQEYLGKRLAANGWAICIQQRDFSLTGAQDAADAFSFRWPQEDSAGRLSTAIAEVLRCC